MPEVVRKLRCMQRLLAQSFEKRIRHIARDAADDVGRDADEIGLVSAAVRRSKEGKAARSAPMAP
jgi:glucose-6-phosphate-specific signal transduction histidine kinase